MNKHKHIMDDKTWAWALVTQATGATIALLAVIGLLKTTKVSSLWLFLLAPPYLVFFTGFIWSICEMYGGVKTSVRRVGLTVCAAYINSIFLGLIVYNTGGDTAIFAPIFLLIPHTTAIFLRAVGCKWCKFNIWIVTMLVLLAYVIAHFWAQKIGPNTGDERAHSCWILIVLLATVILTTVLSALVPHGKSDLNGVGQTPVPSSG